ncbi:MAG TPA: AMP-dependent synthetase, partial [Solibacterales bacterium]|nr:AMP-dependent synthetase [Bryobacterales bacterium]
QALKCQCFAGYGLTETCPVLTTALPKPGVAVADTTDEYRRKAMAGWAAPGVELRVVDL